MTDYEAARDAFRAERPAQYNFARAVIDDLARRRPDKTALFRVDRDGRVEEQSFSDLADRSRRLAHSLEQAGVTKGSTALIILGREIAWWEAMTACLRNGVVASPGTVQLSAKDIAYRIEASGAICVIVDSNTAEKVDRIADACPGLRAKFVLGASRDGWITFEDAVGMGDPDYQGAETAADDESLCYFTSGTTGKPKMTMHNHAYPLGHESTGRYWLDLREDDLHWNISDTGWAKAAWSSYFGPWLQGAGIFIHAADGFDAAESLAMFERFPITTLCAAPTIYRMFVLEDLDSYTFPDLRHCVAAGEPLNPEIVKTWERATGLIIRDGYGQTETTLLCGSFPCLPSRPGSMGKPAPGIELAVIDETGDPLPPGKEGDIAVRVEPERPIGLFVGYKNDPEGTAACFRGPWYLTGDRAMRDDEGFFWFVGRADDVILSSGYRIGPFEVESALVEHPAVAESAVIGCPDPVRGEIVKACVVLAKGHAPNDRLITELQEHVKSVTAPYKYPRRIEFVDSLPKTISGKIRRVELRAREL